MTRKIRLDGDKELLATLGSYANVKTVTDSATLDIDDAGGLVIATKGTAATVTIPADTFAVGTKFDILQGGAGAITVAAGSGATLVVDATFTKVTAGQYSKASVTCIAANSFVINGELVPA